MDGEEDERIYLMRPSNYCSSECYKMKINNAVMQVLIILRLPPHDVMGVFSI